MTPVTADNFDGEWDMTPTDLSLLFHAMGWEYAMPNLTYGIPDAGSIRRVFADLINEVNKDKRPGVMVSRGRFLAVRSEGLSANPDDWAIDLYLNVGCVFPDIYDDEDEGA